MQFIRIMVYQWGKGLSGTHFFHPSTVPKSSPLTSWPVPKGVFWKQEIKIWEKAYLCVGHLLMASFEQQFFMWILFFGVPDVPTQVRIHFFLQAGPPGVWMGRVVYVSCTGSWAGTPKVFTMGEKMIEGEEQNKLSVWFCDDLDNVSLRTFHKSNEAIQLSC